MCNFMGLYGGVSACTRKELFAQRAVLKRVVVISAR